MASTSPAPSFARRSPRGGTASSLVPARFAVGAQRDIVEELRTVTSSEPIGAFVTHLRCGTPFRIQFDSNAAR